MKVFVVMGNDFPDSVFSDKATADAHIAKIKEEDKDRSPRIYWRVHEFELNRMERVVMSIPKNASPVAPIFGMDRNENPRHRIVFDVPTRDGVKRMTFYAENQLEAAYLNLALLMMEEEGWQPQGGDKWSDKQGCWIGANEREQDNGQ